MVGTIVDHEAAESFAVDGLSPGMAVKPSSVAELAKTLALAAANGWAVVPWGGGTHQALGNRLARYDLALLTGGLDRVIDHEPADLTLTVGAGMTLAAVQAHLAAHGQWLPLDAEDPARATIGGLLSAGVAGPHRLGYGAARDRVLWLEAARADGTIVHGGAKVVKNVAGYDTPKLFLGSLGSAGVIAAATFRVEPMPETALTVLLPFETPSAAEAAIAELALGRLAPTLLTLAHGPADWGGPYAACATDAARSWVLAVGADGPDATTAWQAEQIVALGRRLGAGAPVVLSGAESAAARRALMAPRGLGALSLKLSVKPTQVAGLLQEIAAHGPLGAWAEAGNGVVRASWAEAPAGFLGWAAIAERAAALGGTWSVERCPPDWKQGTQGGLDVWGPDRGERFLMRRLKATLDPHGLLNPGRYAGG